DRHYLGRNWVKRVDRRMDGACFFETLPDTHAHLIVTPPKGILTDDFETEVTALYSIRLARRARTAATHRGHMLVQRIGPTEDDLRRTLNYATKEPLWRRDA